MNLMILLRRVTLEDGKLPKGIYKLTQDIAFDEEDHDTPDALEVMRFKYLKQSHQLILS